MRFFAFALLVFICLERSASAQYSVQLDLTEQKVYLLYNDRAIMESPVSSGRPGHLTPTGAFHISNKDLKHVSSIYGRIVDRSGRTVVLDADIDMTRPAGTRFINAPMRYFMQFAPGIGLHAGFSWVRPNAGGKGHSIFPGCLRRHSRNRLRHGAACPSVSSEQ